MNRDVLRFCILGCGVEVECADPAIRALVVANYGAMPARRAGTIDLEYRITRTRAAGFRLEGRGRRSLFAADDGELIFLLDKDLTIEIQKLRRELYFLHAAALAYAGKGTLLVGGSGHGKSTTAWALLHHGFQYLSDELAPLDLKRFTVEPYARALCLKREPPPPYCLAGQTARTSLTLHVPVACLPGGGPARGAPLAAVFVVEYRKEMNAPQARALGKAEAAARLFAHALNPLAHPEDGLAGAAAIAEKVPSFHVQSADLGLTCKLIRQTLAQALGQKSRAPRARAGVDRADAM
ncbi:MAG TPA: hypothetical protein VNL14_10740 [Candidatus Acidoferrales bacterium]|nr:hypothetical protein [Candidatus Acidoferrales bacterium]